MSSSERDVETGFLFASPSLWSGIARLLDLWGKFDNYNLEQSAEDIDAIALHNDWRVVGQDMRDAWRSLRSQDLNTKNGAGNG